ncbi:DctP family TRAP transporter solute-binding subunit [Neoroseomonas oryzicola]|uniref:DctP family TRAP transporter solute-binding subunit n=1 Tax=Neoroseomonas oryzicola TaxID=535904 RepID=A0A9X9WGV3_9PROT|nr:DctP family TRAP transporter solute-binding subunit [Neoroseomonas oryzicola]MBR0659563.1 DctP family TRAP transporter solute-binding subunit [Neoroseomonas oryzicola]NKE16158.1 DctP family TRAP transporter solute-binding subunit [Neoroseomonas oryzicola]
MTLTRRAALAALAVVGLAAAPAVAQTTITLQHPLPSSSHYGAGAAALKESFERATGGRFRVNIQRNDNEREIVESVQIGTVECYLGSTGPVGNFVPAVRVLDVPFLFRDYAHARGVLDSDIGQQLLGQFQPRGLVGVIWLENGFRHLTNSRREVNAPSDVRGLKVRTMENQVHMRAFSTLGALPTPMAFSELVPALQQGTVDGQENPIPVIVANNLNQVQRYLTLTGHVYSPAILICNPAMMQRLSAADRAAFMEAARAAQQANRDKVTADENSGIEELRRRGMQVVTQVDTAAFQQALAAAFAQYERELDGATLRRIRDWRPN